MCIAHVGVYLKEVHAFFNIDPIALPENFGEDVELHAILSIFAIFDEREGRLGVS